MFGLIDQSDVHSGGNAVGIAIRKLTETVAGPSDPKSAELRSSGLVRRPEQSATLAAFFAPLQRSSEKGC